MGRLTAANFDRLASVYRALEYLAFGRALECARTALLASLSSCDNILLVGDGDGRCLARLLEIAPRASITSVDASVAMIARARRRVTESDQHRVTFEHADVRAWRARPDHYDAILTMFVLDCFTPTDVEAIVASLVRSLRPGGRWLFVDFAIAPRGLARLHARLWVTTLYAFFRYQTGIEARALPPSEAILERHGLRRRDACEFRAGLIRSVLFERE